ncbi:MAG: four-carbon acid sugar kinase family protein [Candidatus Rokubacteria bacterium]|nr:four-carbon acid sugar kinase family protein [Candidatus Rokubacteria bacterium]
MSTPSLTIVADDLTGACDTGALFAGAGLVGVIAPPVLPDSAAAIVAVDTETRRLTAAEARHRLTRLGPRLGASALFKKIDSTLRGPVGAEIEALLEATGRASALVCPALPAQGRTVVNGVLRVDGVRAHDTPIGRDADYGAPTSEVLELLEWSGSGAGRRARGLVHLSLGDVRAGVAKILHAIERSGPAIVAADAETDADLDALAAAFAERRSLLLAGSAGLGGALARALGHHGPPPALPAGRGWLIVVGSVHPASRAQLDALAAHGTPGAFIDGVAGPDLGPVSAALARGGPCFLATRPPAVAAAGPPPLERGRALAAAAAVVIADAPPDLLVVTGGETAYALVEALGATRLDLLGAPRSGLALGALGGRGLREISLLTKAGGFGGPELLLDLLGGPGA